MRKYSARVVSVQRDNGMGLGLVYLPYLKIVAVRFLAWRIELWLDVVAARFAQSYAAEPVED